MTGSRKIAVLKYYHKIKTILGSNIRHGFKIW